MFVGPLNSSQTGPMILNPQGQLVWFNPNGSGGNLAVQRYQGHPVLTWWQGRLADGVAQNPSGDVIVDRSYRTVAVVHAGYGYATDLHDFQLTPEGTAYLDAPVLTQADLRSVGGPAKATVIDYVVQEVDVRTGKVLWEWHALNHVPFSASYVTYRPRRHFYDYFHLNSIQRLPNGNLVISARNTWAIYEISRATGRVIWTLGGRDSSFRMGSGTNFEWQHDARLRGQALSLFDDAGYPPEERQSSAKFLRLDLRARTASLIHRFTHFPPVISGVGGNAQTLPNGNVFVDWGNQPQFSEYTPGGRQLFNFRLPLGVGTYRAFRFPWIGQPATPPSLAVSPRPDGHVTAYASWNGATQVTAWRILGGSGPRNLRPLGVSAPHRGFETAIDVPSEPRYFAAQALSHSGRVLGRSSPRGDPPHLAVFGSSAFVHSERGEAGLPVGCLDTRNCPVSVTMGSHGAVWGRSARQTVPGERARLIHLRLTAAGRRALGRATHHHLKAHVLVRSTTGLSATTTLALHPYSAAGTNHQHSVPDPAGVRVSGAQTVGPAAFVSPGGRAGILTACYAVTPCQLHEALSAGGLVIGRTSRRMSLGVGELGYIPVQLDRAGQRKLNQARGNRLPVHVELTYGGRTRSGQIDLIRYG
jgi:Arylsulfotransferase (ASST)